MKLQIMKEATGELELQAGKGEGGGTNSEAKTQQNGLGMQDYGKMAVVSALSTPPAVLLAAQHSISGPWLVTLLTVPRM